MTDKEIEIIMDKIDKLTDDSLFMSDLETIQSKDEPPAKESDNLAQIIKREIKTYVLRAGRMTAAQQKAYDELAPSWCIPFEKK